MSDRKWLILLAAAVGVFAGCGDSSRPEVVVYVAVDRANAEPILAQFEHQTGVRVRAVYDAEATKTTGLVSRLLAEAQRPRCDVFWNNELVQTLMLADRGLLAEYDSPRAAAIPAAYRDPQHRWTGVAARARVIAYNTELVDADDVPQTLAELADEKWRGRWAIAHPGFGTTRTHVAALFAALGEDRATSLMRNWLANDVQVLAGNAMVKNRIGRATAGASPILVGLTDTDDVRAGQAEGFPIEMVFPDRDSIGTLVTPTTVGLIADAPHPDTARRLIDYLVSDQTEAKLTAGDSGYLPLRGGGQRLPPAIDVSHDQLLEQLEPSSRWVAEHFR